MKKLLIFTIIAIFGFVPGNAQDINFGAKAGVNFSDITGPDVDSFTGRTGFHVGLVAEIMITETFAFQPEIMYSAQGSDYEESFEGVTFKGEATIDYINIPLMAKLYVGEGGFSVEAGPQVGLLMSAKFKEDDFEEDIKDDLKSIDFGVNLGLGYKMESGLNFGARYNLGLSDANDSGIDDGAEYKNSVIQAYVGFFF